MKGSQELGLMLRTWNAWNPVSLKMTLWAALSSGISFLISAWGWRLLLGGPSPGEQGTAVTTWLQDPAQRRGVRAYGGWGPPSDNRSPLCVACTALRRLVPCYVLWLSPPWKVSAVRTTPVIFVIIAQLSSRDPAVCYSGENYSEEFECLSTNTNYYPMGWRYFSFWVLILEMSPSPIAHGCEAVSLFFCCVCVCVCVYWEGV